MNRKLFFTVIPSLLLCASLASAQDTRDPSTWPSTLSESERDLLMKGEFSSREIFQSGLLGTFVGIGMGHLAQRRWREGGWVYAVGEGGAVGVVAAALQEGDTDAAIYAAYALAGIRAVQILDVWIYPNVHNARVRRLRERIAEHDLYMHVLPDGDGGVMLGLSLRF